MLNFIRVLPPNIQIFSNQITKTWCFGGGHYSEPMNQNVYEKYIPKPQKVVKVTKSICKICGQARSQTFTK